MTEKTIQLNQELLDALMAWMTFVKRVNSEQEDEQKKEAETALKDLQQRLDEEKNTLPERGKKADKKRKGLFDKIFKKPSS